MKVHAVRAVAGVMLAGFLFAAGCDKSSTVGDSESAITRTVAPPGYSVLAAEHNSRVARLDMLWARTVVRLTFVDENGKTREEQGEGLLQVVRPDRMGMSIKKAGKNLFWFGGDQTRYWLFDLVDQPVARVGRHDKIAQARRRPDAGIGMDINPLEMIRLLGITPLPVVAPVAGAARGQTAEPGSTAWSKNGRLIEVTTALPNAVGGGGAGGVGGTQVLSFEPETYLLRRVTLLDRAGQVIALADHEKYEPIEIENYGGVRPRMAAQISAQHPASKTQVKLDLSEMRNSRVAQVAFRFESLCESLGVNRVIDLDAPPAPPAPAAQPEKKTSAGK